MSTKYPYRFAYTFRYDSQKERDDRADSVDIIQRTNHLSDAEAQRFIIDGGVEFRLLELDNVDDDTRMRIAGRKKAIRESRRLSSFEENLNLMHMIGPERFEKHLDELNPSEEWRDEFYDFAASKDVELPHTQILSRFIDEIFIGMNGSDMIPVTTVKKTASAKGVIKIDEDGNYDAADWKALRDVASRRGCSSKDHKGEWRKPTMPLNPKNKIKLKKSNVTKKPSNKSNEEADKLSEAGENSFLDFVEEADRLS